MSEIEIFENERAKNYDSFVQTWIPNYDFFIELLPRLLQKENDKNLLVVGCGTGNEITCFAKADSWTITGVDPSPEMISQAREKLKPFPRITLVNGELKELPTAPAFGAATLLLVLHFLKDNGAKQNLLLEIAKRLKAGAPLVVLDITGDENQIKSNLEVLRSTIPAWLEEEQIQQRVERIESALHYVSENRLNELLMQ
ncbi:MAG: class I SAM-dependent methyltransferase, partial [Bacteroidota bacterium]